MIKREELTNPNSCMNKAADDEPTFVLLARDECAADAIRFWASLRWIRGKNGRDDTQIVEALTCADEMEAYRNERK